MFGRLNKGTAKVLTIPVLLAGLVIGCSSNSTGNDGSSISSVATVKQAFTPTAAVCGPEYEDPATFNYPAPGPDTDPSCAAPRRGPYGATPSVPRPSTTVLFQDGVSPTSSYQNPGAKISANTPDTPNGDYPRHDAGYNGGKFRSLLAFDISAIPPGKEIASVSLSLRVSNQGTGDQTLTLDLHALTRGFDESQVTWNSAASGQPWSSPGGDFSAIPLSSLSMVPSAFPAGTIDAFASTYSFEQAVQSAYTGSKMVYLLLKLRDENATDSRYFRFDSDDSTSPSRRPILSVAYRDPVTSVNADDFQFNATDATAALQNAINSGAGRVIVRKMSADWNISAPIQLVSNQDLIFQDGVNVRARSGFFNQFCDSLFLARELSNVRMIGQGNVNIQMNRDEFLTKVTSYGQHWRHGLSVQKSTNVEVFNLNFKDAPSDGISVGRIPGHGCDYSASVLIRNVTCDGSGRNGLSVTSGSNVVVENSAFSNTGGIAPMVGVDIEPASYTDRISNVVFRNIVSAHNQGGSTIHGGGITAAIGALNGGSEPVSLHVLDSQTIDNRNGLSVVGHPNIGSPPVAGSVEFVRSSSNGSANGGIVVWNKVADGGFQLAFTDCKVYDAGRIAGVPPVGVYYDTTVKVDSTTGQTTVFGYPRVGGASFNHCFVQSNKLIEFFGLVDDRTPGAQQHTLANVSGDFIVDNERGAWTNPGATPDAVNVSFVQGDGITPMRIFSQWAAPRIDYEHQAVMLQLGAYNANSELSDLTIGIKGNVLRSVLSFDISDIPAGKTITGATLRFQNAQQGVGDSPVTLAVYELATMFDETQATWFLARKDAQGNNVYWSTPGGDFDVSQPLSSTTFVPSTVPRGDSNTPSYTTFATSSGFKAAAQRAYNGDKILKLMVKLVDESTAAGDRYLRWRSDDTSNDLTFPNRQAAGPVRPRLTVTYSPGP